LLKKKKKLKKHCHFYNIDIRREKNLCILAYTITGQKKKKKKWEKKEKESERKELCLIIFAILILNNNNNKVDRMFCSCFVVEI